MAIINTGSSTAGAANVDSNYNLQVRTPSTESQAGFVQVSSQVDDGVVTGTRYVKALEASADYRLRVGMDSVLFDTSFEGSVVPQALLSQVVSTYTIAQTGGFLVLNSASSTAAGHAVIRTYRAFPLHGSFGTYAEFWIKESAETATNGVSEWGFGYATTTSAPTDGVFFRRVGSGQLRAVINYAGTEATYDITSPSAGGIHHYVVAIHNDDVEFWIDDQLYKEAAVPVGQASPSSSSQLPIFARVYSGGVMSAGRQLSIGKIDVSLADMNAARPWGHAMCGSGGGAYQTQLGTASGGTVSRASATRGWPASATAVTAGTFTATSAPAIADLGGRFLTPAISTLTTDADYPIFAYLNPAGTATLPGKTLYITGVKLGAYIATAAASTNGIMICTAIGIGSTAAATTTTEGAAAIAARIIPLGQCYFKSTAVVGDASPSEFCDFSAAPLVCPPNTYVHIIFRPVGTVTSNTLVLNGMVTIVGYHE